MCFTTVFATFPRQIYAIFATFPSISSFIHIILYNKPSLEKVVLPQFS